ncbi:MAG TPA: LamG-like jellyroll fold domain-containing protein [Nocardioidaceae bacterium]|nr:LamG-like jellyroll fold domain-containing protein [Nocardioidaceae bacterium]
MKNPLSQVSRGQLSRAVACVVLVGAAMLPTGASQAATGDVGYRDFAYGAGSGSGWVDPNLSPTASKPQSKLWYAQGKWWGVLNDPSSNDFHIHWLDTSTQTWRDTGVVVDTRNGSHSDALWDGQHLFIASHLSSGTGSGNAVQVTRYTYSGSSYGRDSGFPVTINGAGVEAAVIDEDSTGRIWATYTQSSKVYVVVSQPGGQSWGSPFTPAVSGTSVSSDDISTIVANQGEVTVVWSNQNDDSIYAATHADSAALTSWQVSKKVLTGPNEADDHINIKSVAGDAAGRLFVAAKTSQNDVPNNANAPLIKILVLGTDNVWRQYVHSRVSDGLTRPIVLIDTTNRMLRVFASGPESGGVVYQKSSPLNNISFASGKGSPFIQLSTDKNINNGTSTKQTVNATSGLVVLASDQVTGRYVHNTMSLGTPPPSQAPTAAFTGTPTSGSAPLNVSFTDQSTGSPTSWSWTFGDGGTSTAQNPTHTYNQAGTYTVSLTSTNSSGSNTATKTGFVTVGSTPPPPSGSYQSTVTADTPAGYWRMGGTGSSVPATVGPSGTTVGGVTSTSGAIAGDTDGARAFDGSSGYVSVPSATALNMTGDLTVEAWVKPTVVQGGVAVQKGGSSGYSVWQYRLGMTSGGQWRGTVFVGSSAYAVTAPGSATLNAWTHLVLTRSGGTLAIYVNGTRVATASGAGTLNTTTSILGIGRSGASATSYFRGSIDEVAVYAHALSAQAVAAHYASGGGSQ